MNRFSAYQPLDVISNALAIASITFIFFYPAKLYETVTRKKAGKLEDALST